jgi:hypothetical protein
LLQAAADSDEAMKIGKAMPKFMPGAQMPRAATQGTAATWNSNGISGASSPAISQSDLNMEVAMLKTLSDMEVQTQELQRLQARVEQMSQAGGQASGGSAASFGWLAGSVALVGLAVGPARKYSAPQRTAAPQMYDISHHDDILSLDAKEEIYNKWDPEKPRDYYNFNPFERNDDGQICDSNGCFPGQDAGYKPPNRPDVSWAIMQEHNKRMDVLKAQPKFNLKGKPGNWSRNWRANLGPTP